MVVTDLLGYAEKRSIQNTKNIEFFNSIFQIHPWVCFLHCVAVTFFLVYGIKRNCVKQGILQLWPWPKLLCHDFIFFLKSVTSLDQMYRRSNQQIMNTKYIPMLIRPQQVFLFISLSHIQNPPSPASCLCDLCLSADYEHNNRFHNTWIICGGWLFTSWILKTLVV